MTLAQMRALVRSPFKWDENDTTATVVADAALNLHLDRISGMRNWRRLQATDVSTTITSSTTTSDVPSTMRKLTGVYIINSDGDAREIVPISWAEQLQNYGDPSQLTRTTPVNYLFTSAASGAAGARKQQIVWAPYPDATYTVRYNGIARVSHLSADADVPWFDEQFHWLLPQFAMGMLAAQEESWDPRNVKALLDIANGGLADLVMAEPHGLSPTQGIRMPQP